ncbi:unnamed protein product [Ranitomeya imitator]|uniref:Reverse transcriptase domain-containing protein n=1 Tax=Ranitomeya imitator TaxID=111125 RepID=A0ABN9M803_9NEOB|nr:unnamed protein product [Ranitomeya imitator]
MSLTTEERETLNILQSLLDEQIPPKSEMSGIITKNEMECLFKKNPRIASLYFLPKVHKHLECPPGRPIISGINNMCEPDTSDILRRMDGVQIHSDTLLVVCDVESLYTSIRHEDGSRAVKFFLETSNMEAEMVTFVLELLQFVLTHNFFLFKGSFFLQLQGTAMGASCSPSYANLFLGLWERDLFLSDSTPLNDKVLSWSRFIDDIFFSVAGH